MSSGKVNHLNKVATITLFLNPVTTGFYRK